MSQPTTEPTGELDTRFSDPAATAVPWSTVHDVLKSSEIFWLATVRRDGRPHVTPLPAMWLDGALHFCTGPDEQKAKNIAVHPAVALTTGTPMYRSGLDVVVEGAAARVTDQALLQRLVAMWQSKLGWPYEVADGGFRDPSPDSSGDSARVATAHVFAVAPTKVLAFAKGEPFGQTRFRF